MLSICILPQQSPWLSLKATFSDTKLGRMANGKDSRREIQFKAHHHTTQIRIRGLLVVFYQLVFVRGMAFALTTLPIEGSKEHD